MNDAPTLDRFASYLDSNGIEKDAWSLVRRRAVKTVDPDQVLSSVRSAVSDAQDGVDVSTARRAVKKKVRAARGASASTRGVSGTTPSPEDQLALLKEKHRLGKLKKEGSVFVPEQASAENFTKLAMQNLRNAGANEIMADLA